MLLEYEREGRYRNLSRRRYVFVGDGATDKIDSRDDVIVARMLPDNIEHHANLLSFTAWYAIARNDLAESGSVSILEYDVSIAESFTAETLAALSGTHCIAGYVPFKLSHPMFLHATPWFTNSLEAVYGVDADGIVRSHLGGGGRDLWTATTNISMRTGDLASFVDWFLPLTVRFRHDPIGAHVHERTIPIFCKLNQIENVYIPGVLKHTQARSHGILAISQEEARDRAAGSAPLLPEN